MNKQFECHDHLAFVICNIINIYINIMTSVRLFTICAYLICISSVYFKNSQIRPSLFYAISIHIQFLMLTNSSNSEKYLLFTQQGVFVRSFITVTTSFFYLILIKLLLLVTMVGNTIAMETQFSYHFIITIVNNKCCFVVYINLPVLHLTCFGRRLTLTQCLIWHDN